MAVGQNSEMRKTGGLMFRKYRTTLKKRKIHGRTEDMLSIALPVLSNRVGCGNYIFYLPRSETVQTMETSEDLIPMT